MEIQSDRLLRNIWHGLNSHAACVKCIALKWNLTAAAAALFSLHGNLCRNESRSRTVSNEAATNKLGSVYTLGVSNTWQSNKSPFLQNKEKKGNGEVRFKCASRSLFLHLSCWGVLKVVQRQQQNPATFTFMILQQLQPQRTPKTRHFLEVTQVTTSKRIDKAVSISWDASATYQIEQKPNQASVKTPIEEVYSEHCHSRKRFQAKLPNPNKKKPFINHVD